MKQMAQLYRVEMSEENRRNAMPGQFVFPGDWSDDVIGFISAVDYETNELEMCLFEPRVMPDTLTRVIKEVVTKDEWAQMLKEIGDKNPEVKAAWIEAVNGPTYNDEESVH